MTKLLQPLDVERIRKDFPILERRVRDNPLVYLDNAATSQKPSCVLDAERQYYEHNNAAVHRGVHTLAEEATEAYESARERIARFIGATPNEVVFTKNATEAINLVAYAISNAATASFESKRFRLESMDEILVTEMEHHANLVPWQQLCQRTGAALHWIGIDDDGRLDLSQLHDRVTGKTKILAFTHQSNVLGTINPVAEVTAMARSVGAFVLLDAAQSVPNMPVDVRQLDVDFLVFSGHKMLGPSGIGVLWGRRELLEALPPFITGGSMIEMVHMQTSTFTQPPQRFEAGVPMTAQAIGLAAAVDYLSGIGMENVIKHERAIASYALERLKELPEVRIVGPTTGEARGSTVSFVLNGIHPHDVGQVLDNEGIEVRVGHHCAWPLHRRLGLSSTTRASFYIYNTIGEVDRLVEGIERARTMFG